MKKLTGKIARMVKDEMKDLDEDTHYLLVYLLDQCLQNNAQLTNTGIRNKVRSNVRTEIDKLARITEDASKQT